VLFEVKSEQPKVIISSKSYALTYVSNDAFYQNLQGFALQGSAVMNLRSWMERHQSVPLLQVFQSSIATRIRSLDTMLSNIQQRYMAIENDIVVTLIGLQAEVESSLRPLERLSGIVARLDAEPYGHAFRYLEMLYEETCISQMAGDDMMYAYMGNIFFDCFQIYLRPIRAWMENGELNTQDKSFFISEVSGEVETTSLWKSRFQIRKTKDDILHAPEFLHAAANKICTTGKSVIILKNLNQFPPSTSAKVPEPSLDFETVCNPSRLQLAPFPALFDVAFDAWVHSKHHYASSAMRYALFDSCGLYRTLEAFSHVYFMADGVTSAVFTNSIFDKLDTLDPSWNDRFTMTELARSAFGALPSISPDGLRAHTQLRQIPDVAKCRRSVKALASVHLKYHLPWPIQIIISPTEISSYQRIFTFLLQIRRSSHILTRQRLIADTPSFKDSSDERAIYYSLRARILWFGHTVYHHITSLVIQPNTKRIYEQLRDAEDVDTMIESHTNYLKSMIDQALLGSKLELIHQTLLKILDLGIQLEDAQAANAVASRETVDQQQKMVDLSFASLGFQAQAPRMRTDELGKSRAKIIDEDTSDDEEKEIDVDLSILSSTYDNDEDETHVEKLGEMKKDFDRWVKFVAGGLRGVARAGGGDNGRSWEILGETLEIGLLASTGSAYQ
jgi:gamma-tubulin complex component 5